MKYARLYADGDGITHFEDVEIDQSPIEFAPPAPPVIASQPIEATRTLFTCFPKGWEGDWHPAPKCQFGIILSGRFEITAGDGESRIFETGSVRLLEDKIGKGHRSRVIGDEDVLNVAIQLD